MKTNKWMFNAGLIIMATNSIAFSIAFVVAYFNGGTSCIIIDRYGEQHLEMIIVLVGFVCAPYTFYNIMKNKWREI